MAKKITTAKQSSGAGFLFEDKVFAWFATAMLQNRELFSNFRGILKKVAFQARSEGWLLDDMVLTIEEPTSDTFHVPFSVKSNIQFNGNGPKQELLDDLWELYLNDESTVFDQQKDYLGIINAPLNSDLSSDLSKLINASRNSTPQILEARLAKGKSGSFSKSQINIIEGFRCPANLSTKHKVYKEEVWKLLSRTILMEFDFEKSTSNNEATLIEYCQNCLDDSENHKKKLLFARLCEIRSVIGSHEGAFIDYNGLVKLLRSDFKLRGLPNHQSDWTKISTISTEKASSIQDSIGGKVKIEREKDLDKLKTSFEENECTFLLGKSGYGKSVLLKHLCEELSVSKTKFIWIDSDITESKNISDYFSLDHRFIDLLESNQDQDGYVIIDAIERFRKDEHLRLLFPLISSLDKNKGSWKFVISCQTDDFEEVIQRLYRLNLIFKYTKLNLETISDDNLKSIQKDFPAFGELLKHSHLKGVLKNLKYLDLLAYNLSFQNSDSINQNFGESDIIDLIWKEEIENHPGSTGEQSSRFLKELADIQAEKMVISVAQSDFGIADLSPLPSLKKNKILKVIDDKITFEHDLFSDWARYKLIRGNDNQFLNYLTSKNLLSPLWAKSIRLYGVYLLEKEGNISEWVNTFSSLNKNNPNEKIIQDLLLESIIYSNSGYSFLELLKETLFVDEGYLLRRFLERFLLKATLPNPQVLEIAKQLDNFSELEASTFQRIPIYVYWPPVLTFIYNNITQIAPLAGVSVAQIAQTWLDSTPSETPFRKQASFSALKTAEWIFDFKNNGNWVNGNSDKVIYKAMLSGLREFPDEVIDLSLKLCRRKPFEKTKKEESETEKPIPKGLGSNRAVIRDAQQWPNGPYERVDRAFSEVSIMSNSLLGMMTSHPEKAKEIILALLIEPPMPISFKYDFHYKYDIVEERGWFPPYYGRGPFLTFLLVNSFSGIDTILELVNFATTQWSKTLKFKDIDIPNIRIQTELGERNFIGDSNTYFWFRSSIQTPHVIASALMALEKFLISKIDDKKDVEPYIHHIIENTNSISFIGLLSFVGKYSPKLFFGPLRPILSIFEFYRWEMTLDSGAHNIEGHQMIGATNLDERTWNSIKEWNLIKQRKISLASAGLQLYLYSNELNDFYEKTREKWKRELERIEKKGLTDNYKTNLVAQFDKENYDVSESNNQILFQYVEPSEITKKLSPLRNTDEETLNDLITPFKYFREIEEGKEYTHDEIEVLWNKVILKSTNISLTEDKFHYLSNELSSILGGIAILFENQDLWVKDHKERNDWTINFTYKVLIHAPSKLSELYMSDSFNSWSRFITKYLPKIWVINLEDRRVRTSVALFCLKSKYDTIEVLFQNISTHLTWSEKNFVQLQNLVIQWSLGTYKYDIARNKNELLINKEGVLKKLLRSIFHKKKEAQYVATQADNILKTFVNKKTPSSLIDWSKERIILPKRNWDSWGKIEKKNNQKESGLDTQMIQHMYSSLPRLSEARDKPEYDHIISIWKHLRDQLTFENGEISDESSPIEEYPQDFTLWVLESISKLVIEIDDKDRSKEFWEPILSYGIHAPYQMDLFLQDLILYNISEEKSRKKLLSQWMKIEEFCQKNVNWKSESRRKDKFEYTLYGVSSFLIRIWDDDYKEFLKQISDRLFAWIVKNQYNHEIIGRLIMLLQKESAIVLLDKALIIIVAFIDHHVKVLSEPAPKGYSPRKFEYLEHLARTAKHLWENHKKELKNNDQTFANYKTIVTFLVSQNEPVGMELQNRIIEA